MKTKKSSVKHETQEPIILEPAQEIPAYEQWLFDPKNKAVVDKLKAALKQQATIDFDTLKRRLKII